MCYSESDCAAAAVTMSQVKLGKRVYSILFYYIFSIIWALYDNKIPRHSKLKYYSLNTTKVGAMQSSLAEPSNLVLSIVKDGAKCASLA